MKYDVIADKIEVRSLQENNKPRYVVKATAMIANKKDIYEFTKNPDGSYQTLKSMFTPHCIQSIKEQAKHKKLFVDSQHELALNTNIKSIVKGKLTPDEQKRMDIFLKAKMLPLAKLNDLDIEDNMLKVDTELNPVFRDVDESHQKYFDAVWYSLENKYLNGVSVNLANPKVISDDNGLKVIDDIDVLGFSYVDAPAHHENSIYEVAIRAMQEGTYGGSKMEDEKVKLEAERKQLDEDKKKFDDEKASAEKQKAEADAATKKKTEIDTQAAEQKKVQDELDAKTEALKKAEEDKEKIQAELNSAKGVVSTIAPPATAIVAGKEPKDDKFYKENIDQIKSEHNKTQEIIQKGQKPIIDNSMSGFGELINLGAQAGNPTADMDKANAEYVKENRLLDKGPSDVMAPGKAR